MDSTAYRNERLCDSAILKGPFAIVNFFFNFLLLEVFNLFLINICSLTAIKC